MAEDKRTFLQGKMNQDLDDRVLPNGEYRNAQNIQITTSEVSDIGSIQNLLGNSKVGDTVFGFTNLDTIGVFFDEKNSRIYYFITNYTCPDVNKEGLIGDEDGPTTVEQADNGDLFCGIYMYAKDTTQPQLLVSGLFLNFSKTHTITGVNLIEDLLFFTDGLNQPRKINVEKAIQDDAASNNPYYYNEDKISVAKFAPFMPALLLDYDQTTLNNNLPTTEPVSSLQTNTSYPDDLIDEKFVRFSYRYRFVDGEYSTIAPFTQVCFIPKTHSFNGNHIQKILKRGQAYFQDDNGSSDGMVNSVNSVNLNIILPSSKLKTNLDINGIEILYKESNSNVVKAVELIEIKNENASDLVTPSNSNNFIQNEGVFQYKYKSTLPYKTLPVDQLPRVYDNIPLSAKAQEIVGNRVIYGNFIQDRQLPIEKGVVGLNFNTSVDAKYDITNPLGNADFNNYYLHKEYPYHSVKQKRTYEVGVVLSDKFGRQSPVLTSTIGDGSITVDAKSNTFNSSTWSENDLLPIQDTSPGNENYCGDALTITFNKEIPSAYAKGTLINVNNELSFTSYSFDLYETNFATNPILSDGSPGSTGGIQLGNLYFYSSIIIPVIDITDFLYLDTTLETRLIGYSEVYMRNLLSVVGNQATIHKIDLNPTTGAVLNISTIEESIFQNTLMGAALPQVVANGGDTNSSILNQTTVTSSVINDTNGNFLIGQITIENASIINEFTVGDYLKGQNVDFVQITNIFIENGNLIIQCDGEPSLSYNAVSGSVPLGYYFYKYKIIPHGWYSYRVVVKQTEQDYNNVYAPNVYDFDNDRDDPKTYIPILADNINKVTRDIEFTNTQETGLSTSKDKLFPKVVPSATNAGLSVQSDNDILDVINIGTSKEQGIKNENDDVFAFISETSKNPLMAQIPFGGSTGNNIGSNTELGLQGTLRTIQVATSGDTKATVFKQANKVLSIAGGNASEFAIGEYLKGSNKDLVKIIKKSGSDPILVECDGSLSNEYNDLTNGESFRVYSYKYGVQDNLAVFETKPFDTALDIYYETSTAGLVHELNEALNIPSIISQIEVDANLSEDILYWDEGNFQGIYAGVINFLDVLDNNITSDDIIEVSINFIRGFVETTSPIADLATQALVPQESIITDQASMPFEILFLDNEWKIKPKNNFYHSVVDGQQFNAYEFNVDIVHQQTSTDVVNLNSQTFNLRLENVAPIVQPIVDIDSSVRSSQEVENVIVGQIPAVNGSADVENNKSGLIFVSKNINPSITSSTTNISDGNTTITVDTSTVLHDSSGDPIIELSINPNTGEISIRPEFFYGVINKTFDVFVYDSDVNFLNSEEYLTDETGIFFGKRTLTTVNAQVTADLIVIQGANVDSDANHPYYVVTNTDEINGQNLFNQDAFFNVDNDLYNCYWTENPSSLEAFNGNGVSQQSMPSAPRHSESGEFFLCSFLDGEGTGGDPAELWSIKIDESGEPRVRKYKKQNADKESSTSDFQYYNHILPTSYRGEFGELLAAAPFGGGDNPKTVTMGGVICIQEVGNNQNARSIQENIDLLGFQGTGINHDNGVNGTGQFNIGSISFTQANGTEHDVRDKLEQGITQWDFEVASEGPFSATNSGSFGDGGFDFDFNIVTGETQGSYKYYTPGNVLSGSFAHPKHRGIQDTFMFQSNNDIEILGYTYKVVYEIRRSQTPSGYAVDDVFWVPHVFLARKGND
tara:strand:- start:4999 stop:10107 length:5109 start_codon:yes stop_codon:yes gene_type:complete